MIISSSSVVYNNYIDEKLLSRNNNRRQPMEYVNEERNIKHFIITIEHAYHFIKHPFTKRPCLTCFEIARLLNIDEIRLSQLVSDKKKQWIFFVI